MFIYHRTIRWFFYNYFYFLFKNLRKISCKFILNLFVSILNQCQSLKQSNPTTTHLSLLIYLWNLSSFSKVQFFKSTGTSNGRGYAEVFDRLIGQNFSRNACSQKACLSLLTHLLVELLVNLGVRTHWKLSCIMAEIGLWGCEAVVAAHLSEMLVCPGFDHRMAAGIHPALNVVLVRSKVYARLCRHGNGSIVWLNHWLFTFQASDVNLTTIIDGILVRLLCDDTVFW